MLSWKVSTSGNSDRCLDVHLDVKKKGSVKLQVVAKMAACHVPVIKYTESRKSC